MSRKRLLVSAIATVLCLVWVWRCHGGDAKPSQAKARTAKSSQDSTAARARRDLGGLAQAFGMLATGTIGLVVIAGRVTETSTGLPVPNAEVVFSGPTGESSVACDESGHYRVELMPGFYRSYARAEGYVAVAPAIVERLPGPVSAAAVALPREGIAPLAGLFRDQTSVNLALSSGGFIEGKVVDRDGNAIEGAVISGRRAAHTRMVSGNDVSESDGGGRYRLAVPAGSITLTASHAEYAGIEGRSSTYLTAGDTVELDLVMATGCIIEGEVVDAGGVRVSAGAFEKHLGEGIYSPIGEIEQGRVRFAQLTPGLVELRAWPWKNPPTASKEYECSEGNRYLGEVFVVPDAEPVLSGYVEDVDGARVPDAFVDVFPLETGLAQQERADEAGEFAFYQLPPGPYQISVYQPGKGSSIFISDVPGSGVPIRLPGTGSLIGSISGFDKGSMIMRFQCSFRLDEAEAARADAISMPVQTLLVPVQRGRFRIDDLPACPITGSVEANGIREHFAVTIAPQQEVELRLGQEVAEANSP